MKTHEQSFCYLYSNASLEKMQGPRASETSFIICLEQRECL